ncbi:hypothetical protein RRG08_057344 [Elysia crispata]|uniref:Uncharacterized protein n=1 Tax=Elysia crispata TaxID=231223 RepID=A0AAE0YJ44_9GAST|nr:hypothetical protein RRG08_057344 [Elysia crispata]
MFHRECFIGGNHCEGPPVGGKSGPFALPLSRGFRGSRGFWGCVTQQGAKAYSSEIFLGAGRSPLRANLSPKTESRRQGRIPRKGSFPRRGILITPRKSPDFERRGFALFNEGSEANLEKGLPSGRILLRAIAPRQLPESRSEFSKSNRCRRHLLASPPSGGSFPSEREKRPSFGGGGLGYF